MTSIWKAEMSRLQSGKEMGKLVKKAPQPSAVQNLVHNTWLKRWALGLNTCLLMKYQGANERVLNDILAQLYFHLEDRYQK